MNAPEADEPIEPVVLPPELDDIPEYPKNDPVPDEGEPAA